MHRATAVLVGRYSNGKVWAISAKNSATGTEMFGGKIDEQAQTLQDPQWGTQYSLQTGDVIGKWCPSPPIIGGLIGAIFPQQGVWVPQVIACPELLRVCVCGQACACACACACPRVSASTCAEPRDGGHSKPHVCAECADLC